MRTSHPGTTGLTMLVLAVLGVGCTTVVDAAFDGEQDFSAFHTWDWEPREEPGVDAPGADGSMLDARLRRLIHRSLAAHGYVHGRERPDFFVRYHLSLQRKSEVVRVPIAPYLLSSHSSSPSYWVWGTDTEERSYQDLRLSLDVSRGSGNVVWRAAMRERLEEGAKPALATAVDALIERFPRASGHPGPSEPAPDQLARLKAPPRL